MHLVLVGHAVTAIYGGLECILGSEIFIKKCGTFGTFKTPYKYGSDFCSFHKSKLC